MAEYDLKINSNELIGLLSKSEGMTKVVESMVNQVLEKELTEYLGVEKHQHSKDGQVLNGSSPKCAVTLHFFKKSSVH